MTWTAPPGTYGAADPLFLLLLALAIEAYAGDREMLRRWIDPRPRLARLVAELARRLNRADRGAQLRFLRGLVVLLALGIAALLAGWLVALVSRHYPFAWVLELLLLTGLLTQRATHRGFYYLRGALDGGSLVQAREALRPLTIRLLSEARLQTLERRDVAYLGLAGLSDRLVAALVAPAFWYVVLGLPGLFVMLCVQVLASNGRPLDDEAVPDPYGRAALLAERALVWLPDRLAAGLLLLAAALVPGASPRSGLQALGREDPGAWSALAGTLDLSPGDAGSLEEDDLSATLHNAHRLFLATCLVQAGAIALLLLLRLGF